MAHHFLHMSFLAGVLALASGATLNAATTSPQAGGTGTAKGIVIDSVTRIVDKKPSTSTRIAKPNPTPDVTFSIRLLSPDGSSTIVPPTRAFWDGDRFQLQFALNQESYVYLLNRTALGDPQSTPKGVNVADDLRVKLTTFRLLFPTNQAGTENKIAAHSLQAIPKKGNPPFIMDKESGEEQLFLIVSAKPLAIDKYFEPQDGTLRPEWNDERNLIETLRSLESNTEVSASKGIGVDSSGTARSQQKPILVSVNLKHYSKTQGK